MDVFLVRHGTAVSARKDAGRVLAERGRAEVEWVAARAVELGVRIDQIHHSGLTRAAETAEILARALDPPGGAAAADGLAPEDDPREALDRVERAREPLMLVGHLPHLAYLTSLLLVGQASAELVVLRPATLVWLGGESGAWRLRLLLAPAATG